ncbi:hypothetical protein BH11MYX4_BH11MYX4_54620 [soil metagenome]
MLPRSGFVQNVFRETTSATERPAGVVLVLTDDALERRRFPSFEQVGALATWPWNADGADEDGLGSSVEYLDLARAVEVPRTVASWSSTMASMALTNEAFVSGHAPRPVCELYPSLAEETTLGSDLHDVHGYDERHLVSVHRELPERERDGWRDRLVKWAR